MQEGYRRDCKEIKGNHLLDHGIAQESILLISKHVELAHGTEGLAEAQNVLLVQHLGDIMHEHTLVHVIIQLI